MTKTSPETKRQAKRQGRGKAKATTAAPEEASQGKNAAEARSGAAPQGQEARGSARAQQKRDPRPQKGKAAKDDRAKALSFLAATDTRDCRWWWWKNRDSLKPEQWANLMKALALLDAHGVSVNNSDIEIVADAFVETKDFMARRRAAETAELKAARAAIEGLESVNHAEVADLSPEDQIRMRELLPGTSEGHALWLAANAVIAAFKDHPKVGGQKKEEINTVLQYGRSIGWDFRVCAAAVFVSVDASHFGGNTHGYGEITKTFRGWSNRNTLPPPPSDLWAEEAMKKYRDWNQTNKKSK